jgi:hypothetical protein
MLPSAAFGNIIVAPNANTNVSGNNQQFGVLDTPTDNVTFQFAYDASQFAGIANGSVLHGIGFRLPGGASTFASPLVYSSMSIEVATAAVGVGSLTTTFASNEGADNTVVRSGALTIPANSFVGGASPNPFFEIAFTTPFVYHGGSLVITVRHTDPGPSFSVDANSIPAGVPATIGNTVANFSSNTATTADSAGAGFYNVPIASFDFTTASVPEPAPLVLAAASLLPALAYLKFRRARAAS